MVVSMPWLTKTKLQSMAWRLERAGMRVIVSATMVRIIHLLGTRNRSSSGDKHEFYMESFLLYSGLRIGQ